MSKENPQAVSISILGKEYLIACPENERSDLIKSADYLDKKMREIRDGGKVIGTDRIAVMAALNITNQMLHDSRNANATPTEVEGRIKNMQQKIEEALFRSRQLELEA